MKFKEENVQMILEENAQIQRRKKIAQGNFSKVLTHKS